MKRMQQDRMINDNQILKKTYPTAGIGIVMLLLFLSPFLASLPAYAAFAVCLFRLVRYDVRVFCTDYCILVPLSQLFRSTGGMSLLVYLSLAAVLCFLVRNGIRGDWGYALLILVMNYLIARFELSVTNFLLCFSQMALLWIMLSKQDALSAERSIKAFCVSLLISSIYALLLRNTWQIQALRGAEVPAYFGSSQRRFQGLFNDPNYYMYLLTIALASLIKLYETQKMTTGRFLIMTIALMIFGILTYSKTFFLMLVILCVIFLIWQMMKGKYIWGISFVLVLLASGSFLLLSKDSPLAVVLTRLTSASNLSDFTTGRTDLFLMYLDVIFNDPITVLFGKGMTAANLGRDPHNLYLEITYYLGLCGLLLIVGYFVVIMMLVSQRANRGKKQDVVSKYLVLLMPLLLNFTLHGMFSVSTYAGFLVAFLSMLISDEKEVT